VCVCVCVCVSGKHYYSLANTHESLKIKTKPAKINNKCYKDKRLKHSLIFILFIYFFFFLSIYLHQVQRCLLAEAIYSLVERDKITKETHMITGAVVWRGSGISF